MSWFCSFVCFLWCLKSLCDSNNGNVVSALEPIDELINYKDNDSLDMKLNVTGIPSKYFKNNCKVYTKSVDRSVENVSLKEEHVDSSSKVFAFEKRLAQSFGNQEIYIQCFSHRNSTQICEYKLPFKLKLIDKLSSHKQHKCLSGGGCEYSVDIKCNTEKLVSELPGNATKRKLNRREWTLTHGNISTEKPDVLYKRIGEVVTFYCDFEGNNSNIYLNWTQMDKDNGEHNYISTVIGNSGQNLSVQIQIHLFDNNTKFVCNAYESTTYKLVASSRVTNIMFEFKQHQTNNVLGQEQRDVIENKKISACNNRDISLSCQTNPAFRSKFWWEINGDKPFKHHWDNFKFQMNDEHMDAQFICLGYNYSYSDGYTRKIQLRQTYYLDKEEKCKAALPTSTSSPNDLPDNNLGLKQHGGSTEIVMYGLVAGAVLAVLLVILLAACYCHLHRKRPNPQEVVTYTAARLQYADLDNLESTGARTRTIQRDDSPYAEIIGFMEPVNK